MNSKFFATIDGNEAAARVAYQLNEVIALFPITPASPMGKSADARAAVTILFALPASRKPITASATK
jgi:pyruvate/2-oxoacid:ferredoxin oxidoreductase alpha subunit